MASITKKSTSTKWIACFTDAAGGRRQRSTGIADEGTPAERSEARRKATSVAMEFEAAARGSRTEAQIRKTITELYNVVNPERRLEWTKVEPFLTQWLERVAVRKTSGTHTRYGSVINRFIRELGPKASAQLGEVTPEDVQKFVDAGLKAGRRPGTLRIEAKILNAAFAYALRQGLIIINPVAAAEVPQDASESKKPFSPAQIRQLVQTCNPKKWPKGEKIAESVDDWKTATLFGAFCGLRLGDACHVRWKNVDLPGKILRMRPEKTRKLGKEIVVPLHPSLEARLLQLPASDDPEAYVTPTLGGKSIGGHAGLSRQFQRVMQEAGIENEELTAATEGGGRQFNALGFHSLRHAYVTALANAGVAQDVRMALAGHASAKVNELYTHRGLESLAAAVGKIPSI